MLWNIHYDIAAVCVYVVIFLILMNYKSFPSRENRSYRLLLSISVIAIILDIVTATTSSYLQADFKVLQYILNMLFLLFFNAVPLLYYHFIFNMVGGRDFSVRFPSLAVIPYAICVVQILTTPLTGWVFSIDDTTGYGQGIGMFVLYAVSLIYLVLSIAVLIRYFGLFEKLQRTAVIFYTISSIAVVVIQYFQPKNLITGFAVSLSMIFIYLTLQNPLEFEDTHTNTFNREAFLKITGDEIMNGDKSFYVLGIHIEGLKFIGEKFGLESTYDILSAIGSYFRSLDTNSRVYRMAWSQFAIVFDSTAPIENYIHEIKKRFEDPFLLKNEVESMLLPYFCCLNYPNNIKNLDDILDILDYSMRKTKNQKPSDIIWGGDHLIEEKKRENAIAHAVTMAIKNQSFEVYYQPIYSVKERSYRAAEALVRLYDEDLGFIPPDEFIPLTERNGQIVEVGIIVFEKVCSFIKEHRIWETNIHHIHVNLSVVQCMQEDLAASLLQLMDSYQIPYSMITLEITETVWDNSGEKLHETMQKLKDKGILFSLDDYGVGFSNTANIMNYQYSVIKFDKNIVWAAFESEQAMIILKYMFSMMKEMQMFILAEGVETREQADKLAELNCEFFQGYYYSKPLPGEAFLEEISREFCQK